MGLANLLVVGLCCSLVLWFEYVAASYFVTVKLFLLMVCIADFVEW